MKYIIGIDSGSQSSKIAIFDIEGNLIVEGKEELRPMKLGENTLVEHPGDDIWESICAASKKAMEKFQYDPKDIIGVGLGSIRCCRVLMKKDGSLAANVISWMDKRTSTPYQHDVPETAYVTSTDGYLTHRLTGEFKDNIGNNFGQWPVDYETWDWSTDPEVLKTFNIPREMLLEAVRPGDILGNITAEASKLTGIPAGIPVVATTSDKAVEGLGAGLLREGTAVISLGTYITAMVASDEMAPADASAYWGIMSSVPKKYILESYGIRRGMWTVSWFKNLLGQELSLRSNYMDISEEEYLNIKAEEVPTGSEGLMTILDWLANPWEPFKRGIMLGFNAHHDYRYMYRSILEGIAYTMKNNCEGMTAELGKDLKEIVIVGGGSNSDLFMQIFADVFNVPAKRNVINGSAGLGAAINTAVGLGVYPDYDQAVEKMVKVKNVFAPKAENVEIYEKLIKVYKELPKYTDEVLQMTYEILHSEE
ncbi:FGGY-family carbohydrate kinase [Lactococcus ileimucosae]|uniref:FGGY-family carbohydrate kinase n=1 Tax=Lactococcus ileimucosae TaxID=2941329 RepID=UPI0035143C54